MADAAGVFVGTSTLHGALNISNSFGTATTLGSVGTVAALSYQGISPNTVSSITTTAGGINIVASGANSGLTVSSTSLLQSSGGGILLEVGNALGGALSLGNGTSLVANSGSITLQEMSTSGASAISLGTNVTIHASGTAKGVGQVNLVMGPVPTSGLVAGVTPSPTPMMITSGGAAITYGTTANTSGTIIITTGSNVLNAAGRNIVFNNMGGFPITLNGSDTIIADPPVGPGTQNPSFGLHSMPLSGASMIEPGIDVPQGATYSLAGQSPGQLTSLAALSNMGASNEMMLGSKNDAPYTSVSSAVQFPARFSLSAIQAEDGVNPAEINSIQITPAMTSLQGQVIKRGHGSGSAIRSSRPNQECRDERILRAGPMLLAPDLDTTVHIGIGTVDVAANAVVLIVVFDGGVAVYNLHDSKHDSVVIRSTNHVLSIAPGRNAVMTNRSVRYFEEVNPANFVGYRRMVSQESGDGMKIFRSEFSVPSMMQGLAPLRQVLQSNDQQNQKLTRSVLKTTAILMSLGDATGYKHMIDPRLAAASLEHWRDGGSESHYWRCRYISTCISIIGSLSFISESLIAVGTDRRSSLSIQFALTKVSSTFSVSRYEFESLSRCSPTLIQSTCSSLHRDSNCLHRPRSSLAIKIEEQHPANC